MSYQHAEAADSAQEDGVIRCVAHLPLVRLTEPEILFARGRLLSIPYEEWRSWESDYRSVGNSYTHNQPAYYERLIHWPVDASPELLDSTVLASFNEECFRVYHSLVLATGARFLSPSMSTTYLLIPAHLRSTSLHTSFWNVSARMRLRALSPIPGSSGVTRLKRIGFLGREAIVDWTILGAAEPCVLSATDVSRARQCFRQLETVCERPAIAHLRPILETLAMTARPEYDGIYGLVHNVRVLETLLAHEKHHQDTIGNRVARRLATLWATSSDDLESSLVVGKQLYSLRSEALHGRNWQRALARTSCQENLFEISRQAAVLAAAAFLDQAQEDQNMQAIRFAALLDGLWKQRRAYFEVVGDAT